jgi:outer membrane assembly lipoprotein YfiO
MGKIVPLTLLICTTLAFGIEPRTWEFRDGQWPEVAAPGGTQARPASEPTLARVEQLLEQRRAREARGLVLNWLLNNRQHPLRDQGLLLMAESLYQLGDRIKAFYYLDELLDTYPESPLFVPALEKQFRIADSFLSGFRGRFLGLRIIGYEDEAIEMLFRIQMRAPGSQLAERALLRTADHYYATAQYDLASDVYGRYADRYPRSPVLDRVLLRQAFANLAQFRGVRFDPTPVVDAREQLSVILTRFPDTAEQENVPGVIERIDRTLARKLYITGDFYQRTGKPSAAAYLYEQVLKQYPDTPEAELAQARLVRLSQ